MKAELSGATITIKKIYENASGPNKILDTEGGSWKIWNDVYEQLNLKENSRYDIGYKKGEYHGKPDNVIKTAFLLESGTASGAAASGTGPAVAANGHAAPPDREKAILTAVLAKLVGPIPLGTREQMANEMTLIYLAAQDACERIVS